MNKFTIGVVGNPNCGKTSLFNALTGAKQKVGNWPGVTVEQKTGRYQYNDNDITIVDLPGTYSLDLSSGDISLDERIARDFILKDQAQLIVNIVDASNLERNLYLTTQLIEMRVPMIVALNMVDVAEKSGIEVNPETLSKALGCPVVSIIASKSHGTVELNQAVVAMADKAEIPHTSVNYTGALEAVIEKLETIVGPVAKQNNLPARWLAIRLLEEDIQAMQLVSGQKNQIAPVLKSLQKVHGDDVDIIIADSRYRFAADATAQSRTEKGKVSENITNKIDNLVLNRILGIPIFLFVTYLMFMFTINLGGAFIDFFDMFAGAMFVDGFSGLLGSLGSPDWLTLLLAQGIGGGIQVVATFIPVIGFLYLFLSLLEDSGYMARAAFVMDRLMRFIGLPGKSFVPMIVGFGCNVPAIMATRTLEHNRDRLLTILMNPFMSCGARLPVYALFAAAFFPVGGQNVVFGLYLIGIMIAVFTGFLMKNTILRGEPTPFVMELPPYHIPTIKNISLRTWDRLKSFILRAGQLIVPMVLVLNVLNSINLEGEIDDSDPENTVLSEVGRSMVPAFEPMGLTEDNWPAAVGIFTGILAKEAVVGTLDATYSALAEKDAQVAGMKATEAEFDFWTAIKDAFATIPEALSGVTETLTDPLGFSIGDVSELDTAAQEQEVAKGTFGAMVKRFDGVAGAFAYLLFILLYFPCVAATATVYRETNIGWTIFVGAWTTGVAYVSATLFYQIATFSQHPETATMWIAAMIMTAFLAIGILYIQGLKRQHSHTMVKEQS
jgi:ferrous iron transport protein B